MRYAMIMAGGAGTRLWPMSRLDRPKQLLPLVRAEGDASARSLLQEAASRLDGLVPVDRRYICTSESYRGAVREALTDFGDDRVLGEPAARDTLNAVGFTAAVLAKRDKDAVFAVFTADHVIAPADAFRSRVDAGFRLVEADPRRLVTFSIKPTYPATGYGYIERGAPLTGVRGVEGAFRVARYVEKPNIQKAEAYFRSGMFSWNSGMFVWKASTLLDCIRRYKPESYEGLVRVQEAWGTPDQQRVLGEVYPNLPKISVDYAIMEPAATDPAVQVCTVVTDVSWLDVGSWPSYGETLTPDAQGNRVGGTLTPENALIVQGKDNLVVSSDPSHTLALLGCEGLIVVHTPEATLVMPREKAEELKALHAQVRAGLK
jgi:mannose-1-phosphate guanylyltransferase